MPKLPKALTLRQQLAFFVRPARRRRRPLRLRGAPHMEKINCMRHDPPRGWHKTPLWWFHRRVRLSRPVKPAGAGVS